MTKRRLRLDEVELWQQIAKTTDPLTQQPKIEKNPPPKPVTPKPSEPSMSIPAFAIGQRSRMDSAITSPQTTSDRIKSASLQMDAKAFRHMKRGKLVPEGKLDLHGMTVDQAHPSLVSFILRAQTRGFRLVLIITGKGQREDPYDPMPRRRGVLKTQVPVWLRMPPVAQAVLQVTEAHQKHGGGGAYYVYLRRLR